MTSISNIFCGAALCLCACAEGALCVSSATLTLVEKVEILLLSSIAMGVLALVFKGRDR